MDRKDISVDKVPKRLSDPISVAQPMVLCLIDSNWSGLTRALWQFNTSITQKTEILFNRYFWKSRYTDAVWRWRLKKWPPPGLATTRRLQSQKAIYCETRLKLRGRAQVLRVVNCCQRKIIASVDYTRAVETATETKLLRPYCSSRKYIIRDHKNVQRYLRFQKHSSKKDQAPCIP